MQLILILINLINRFWNYKTLFKANAIIEKAINKTLNYYKEFVNSGF